MAKQPVQAEGFADEGLGGLAQHDGRQARTIERLERHRNAGSGQEMGTAASCDAIAQNEYASHSMSERLWP
jgi:hypothetical protein